MLSTRRPLSALFALLYLLLAAGGEALQHGGASDVAAAHPESHYHAPGDGNDDCPPPSHDENHCPACKLAGLRCLPSPSRDTDFAGVRVTLRTPSAADDAAPALRSHAPPNLRAPPLG